MALILSIKQNMQSTAKIASKGEKMAGEVRDTVSRSDSADQVLPNKCETRDSTPGSNGKAYHQTVGQNLRTEDKQLNVGSRNCEGVAVQGAIIEQKSRSESTVHCTSNSLLKDLAMGTVNGSELNQDEFKLVPETLYLTIPYVDRFLSSYVPNKQRQYSCGVTSMLSASRYEDINPLHVKAFCYITFNTYTKRELVKMESDILKLLKFELGNSTIKTFLRRVVKSGLEGDEYPNAHHWNLFNVLSVREPIIAALQHKDKLRIYRLA